MFLKAAAFFFAIIMITSHGFRIMMSVDKADKIKNARTGILNVLMALIFIKLIDYIFFIAQMPSFAQEAVDFIIELAKIL